MTHVDDFEVIRHVDHVLRPGQATTGSASLVRAEMKQFTQTKGRKVMRAVARARKRVWARLVDDKGCLPASVVVGGRDVDSRIMVLDVDATVVKTVSDQKEGAKGTFKGGVGYHPLTVWCGTPPLHDSVMVAVGGTPSREVLVMKLRRGTRGRIRLVTTRTCSTKQWASSRSDTDAMCWYAVIVRTGPNSSLTIWRGRTPANATWST